jgi:hypothetical protein
MTIATPPTARNSIKTRGFGGFAMKILTFLHLVFMFAEFVAGISNLLLVIA